ncbi:MAG TPA: glutathione S-transferase family protein [Kofleriaceae bacterium]|jgi:glutathione S-transferase|nr:glutathione S-transferase family protein [Kofleriaceae bacterium]
MALTLYVGTKRYSSWSLRPYLALAHAGASFTTETIVLDRPDTKAQILAVNPAGKVPALHDGGLVIAESLAICEYVAELFPTAGLWPDDRAERARARAVATEMHGGFAALRREMPMALGVKQPGIGRTPESIADIARVTQIWRDRLAASGGPLLFGTFTIADAMFAPVATRFDTYEVELDDPCAAYVRAILDLPAMRAWARDAAEEPPTR